jgi:hypothetical protein
VGELLAENRHCWAAAQTAGERLYPVSDHPSAAKVARRDPVHQRVLVVIGGHAIARPKDKAGLSPICSSLAGLEC